jgi:hypothetical protein
MSKKQRLAQIKDRMLMLKLKAERLRDELATLAETANELPADWKVAGGSRRANPPLISDRHSFSPPQNGFNRLG